MKAKRASPIARNANGNVFDSGGGIYGLHPDGPVYCGVNVPTKAPFVPMTRHPAVTPKPPSFSVVVPVGSGPMVSRFATFTPLVVIVTVAPDEYEEIIVRS